MAPHRPGPRGYYADKLSAERLRACYECAPPRTKAYLEAEIAFVLTKAKAGTVALELGCGYGRVLKRMIPAVRRVIGVDNSLSSLQMARGYLREDGKPPEREPFLLASDARSLALSDGSVDLTICIQNGISALKVDPRLLFAEARRVTRAGGSILFSSYSPSFWEHRLAWFRAQSARGLIGELDEGATRDGVIVCKDGFRATTASASDFAQWARGIGIEPEVVEVECSSLFCVIPVPQTPSRRAEEAEGSSD